MELPPIKIGFRLWLLKFPYSFTHFRVCVCGWGMCLQNLYQWNERDERGKWRTWFFSKEKALPFHTKKLLHFLGPLRVFIVWWLLILSPLPCLIALCVCVCARCKKSSDWCNLLSTEIVQLATYLHPKVARWSRGAHLHSQTNTCHVDYASNLGREQVASSSWDLGLMLLLVFKERLKYTTPTYMKTQKKIYHQ